MKAWLLVILFFVWGIPDLSAGNVSPVRGKFAGATGIASVKLTLTPDPVNRVFRGGDDVQFGLDLTFETDGRPAYTLTWRKLGRSEILSTEETLSLNDMTAIESGRYYCLVTDTDHSSTYTSDTVEIKVIDTKVNAYGFTRLCLGDTVKYGVAVSDTFRYAYTWYHLPSADPVRHDEFYTVEPVKLADAGEYYCKVEDLTNGFVFLSDTLDVRVSGYPQVGITVNGVANNAAKSFAFCYGSEVTLTVANGESGQPEARFLWTGNALEGDSGDPTAKVNLKHTAVYRAMITNNGCVREDSVELTMVRPDVLLPESRYVIEGENVTLRSSAVGDNYTYSWTNGTNAGVATSKSYTFKAVKGKTAVALEVKTADALQCTNSDTCQIIGLPKISYTTSVNDGYVISRKPLDIIQTDTVLCGRQPLTLEVAYGGYDGYTYEWMKIEGASVSPVDTGRIMHIASAEVTAVSGVKYFCRAYDVEADGYVYSDTVKVVVKYRPVAEITEPDGLTGQCGGYLVTLKGRDALQTSPMTEYRWTGAGIVSGQHSSELTAKMGVNGFYRLEVGMDGCWDTTDIYIPTIIRTVDIASQLILPQATDQVQFVAARPEGGILTWYPNADPARAVQAGSGEGPTAYLNIQEGDSLVVVKMDKEGCSFYDTCIVMIREFIPSADPAAPDDGFALSYPSLRVTSTVPRVCIGRDITLSVYNLGYDNYEYEWRKVGVPDQTGLSDSISYTIFHAEANDYGKYYCVAVDPEDPATIIYSDTLTLTVDEGPEAIIDRDGLAQACYGEVIDIHSSTLFGGSGAEVADVLLWTGEGIVSGQGTPNIKVKVGDALHFTLRASKNEGCWSEDTITIPVVKPQVKIYPSLTSLEKGKELTFRAETAVSTFEWGKNGVTDAQTGKEVNMTFDSTGYVTVIASEKGCMGRDTARVFVKFAPTFNGGENDGFTLSRVKPKIPGELQLINACPDSLLTFRILYPEVENFRYIWWKFVPGGSPQLIYEGAEYTFNVKRDDGGRYFCTASEPDGTSDGTGMLYSDTLLLQVGIGPIAQITPTQTVVCIDGEVSLDASASADGAGGAVTYHWTGEGITAANATDAVITVSPQADAVYTVRVSNEGCSDTASVAIQVNSPVIGLPDRVQLPAPNASYKVKADIPQGTTVEWSFRETATNALIPGSGDRISVARDGWAIARATDGNGCTVYDSCYIRVRQLEPYYGGEDDGFSVLEVSTNVWLEPTIDTLYLCLNNRLSLKAGISGLGRYTYSWHRVEDDTEGHVGPELGTAAELDIDYMGFDQAGKYYCIISDLEDLKDSKPRMYYTDSIQVLIKNGPVAKIEQKDGSTDWNTCLGSETVLFGGVVNAGEFSGVTYTWSGDNFELMSEEVIKARPLRDGVYLLTVKDGEDGCQDTVHVKFNISSPKVRIPATYQLAASGNITIQAEANGTGNFTWHKRVYPSTSLTSDNPAVINVTEDTRIIVCFQQGSCYGFDTTEVFVKYPQTFGGGDDDGFVASDLELKVGLLKNKLDVCRGWDIVIPLYTAELGRVLNYKWYKVGDESRTVLSEESTLVLRANSMDDAGEYYCIVADPSIKDNFKKTVSTDTATVTMINGPLAEISVPNANRLKDIFCRGSEETISALATENKKVNGSDVYAYEWFGEGITFTARDYEITAKMGNSGRYIVKASLGECYTYDTVDMQIYEPDIYVQPVVFLPKPENVAIGVDNPAGDDIMWRFYYNNAPDYMVEMQPGDTLKYRVIDDGFAIVERYDNRCVGYDTCRFFVKTTGTFSGGEDDGFVTGGSGAYCKPIVLTDEVCEGNVATLYVPMVGDDFYRYKWVKVGEESREFPSSPLCKFESVTKKDEGYYYCIITDVNNDKTLTTERAYMKVKELPKSSIRVDETSVCYGEDIRLEADNSQLKPDITYSYLWGGKGLKNYVSPVTEARIEEDGMYRLVVSDGDCYVTDSVSVSVVKTRLEVETIHHLKKGEGLTMTAKVNGSATEPVTWLVGSNYYRNINPLELAASSLTKSMAYTVSTTGKCTVELDGMIYVRENTAYAGGNDDGYVLPNNLPQILDQCDVLLGCNVDTAVLWVSVLESENLIYSWEKYFETGGWKTFQPVVGDTHVSGQDSARLIFKSILADDGGRYRCKIRNNYGYTYSREIRLVKGGTPDLSAYPIVGTPVCEKTEFTFITNADIPHGGTAQGTNLHWKWYYSKDGINFSQRKPEVDHDNPSFTVKPCKESDEGYYMVQAENFCGSAYDTTFQEIWEAPRFVQQPSDIYVCDRGSVEVVTEVEGGGTYKYSLWQVNVDNKGNYVSDKRRMMREQTSPSYTFNMVEAFDDGYYQWRVSNQCDSARSKLFRLTVEQPIVADFELVDTTVCAGVGNSLLMVAQSNVTNPTPTLQYYWEKDGVRLSGSGSSYRITNLEEADAGVYICWAKHSCPEKQIKQYTVRTKSRPKITMPVELNDGGNYCEGATVEMKIDYTSDAGDVKCFWVRENTQLADDGHFSGTHTWHMTINNAVYADRGTYYVKLQNDCPGVTSSNQVYLNIKEKARFTRDLSDQAAKLCVGSTLTLSVSTSGVAPITYTWMKNGEPISGARSSSLKLSNVTHDATGEYACYIQNECSGVEGATTKTTVEVITPVVYEIQGGGGYCAEDFREIRLSGFETGVTYTLKRRNKLDETSYTTLRTIDGDTVSTPYLTFGRWGTGYYHVEASARKGTTTCTATMQGEIYIYQKPTPQQFDFFVSDPMCAGERYGSLKLAQTETQDVEYELQVYRKLAMLEGWVTFRAPLPGTGAPLVWENIAPDAYRLIARNKVSGCEVQIGENDTIAERPYPVAYDLFAVGGDTTACYGMESDVVLQLANSEKTCRYTLYKDGETTGRTESGNLIHWDKVKGGIYTVHAVTNYGCEKDMGRVEVVDLPQLDLWLLSGDRVFCQEETGERHYVVQEGSTPGIEYRLYAASSSVAQDTMFGDGKYLNWPVTLTKDETYYVVARDTHDMCIQNMGNEVNIEANKLKISVIPDTLIIVNTKAHLWVNIENAMGTPEVVWAPAGKYTPIEGSYDVMTEILTKGELYAVTVQDDYCSAEGMVQVNVEGQELAAELRASDCFTPIDTLYLCEGDNVSLCAFVTGGGGDYVYSWTDDFYTDSIPVAHKSKITYTRNGNQDGFVALKVQSAYKDHIQEVLDTVWIRVRKKPDVFLENGSLTCVVPGADTAVRLSSTEAGVVYELFWRPQVTVAYVSKGQVTGDGNAVSFPINAYADAEHAGYYQLKATKNYTEVEGNTQCVFTTPVFQIRRAPKRDTLRAGDFTEYCEGERKDTLYLGRSETDVTYRLLRGSKIAGQNPVFVEQKTGTGDRLEFRGTYGTGHYQVVAALDRCVDTMARSVDINSKPRPVIDPLVEGMHDHCISESAIRVKIVNPKFGVRYSIYQQNNMNEIVGEAGGSEDFPLTLPDPVTVGNYFLVAYDPSVQCSDTVRGLTVIADPGSLTLPKTAFKYCNNEAGVDGGEIIAVGADPLVKYELRDALGNKIGDFMHLKDDTICYNGVIQVTGTSGNEFDIYANAGTCSAAKGYFNVGISYAPSDMALLGDTLGCIGMPHLMGLATSATGVTYSLYKDGDTEPLQTLEGGGKLTFGYYQDLGTYSIRARNAEGCESVMSHRYHIRELPTFYKIYTEGNVLSYCEAGEGVQFGITGTQEGVIYYLQTWDIVKGGFKDVQGVQLSGIGSGPMLFGGRYKSGTYRVRTDYCNLPMLDTIEITERPLPALVNLDYEGKACIDSLMSIVVKQPESGSGYMLKYNGVDAGMPVLPGDAEVKWDIAQVGSGVYTVSAEKDGCTRELKDKITAAAAPLIGELQGIVTNKCEGDTAMLYLDEWEGNAVYSLYTLDGNSGYEGTVTDGRMVFAEVSAGSDYYVSARRENCTVVRGAFEFPGIALPVLAENTMQVIDCQPDRISSIQLLGLKSDYQYTLAGMTESYQVKAFAGDTLIRNVSNGEYGLVAYDPLTTCTSAPLAATVRNSVPQDSIVGQLEYCQNEAGVQVHISGQTYGVLYTLKNADTGAPVDSMTSATVFNKTVPAGRYVFKSERVGLWGGCWTTDTFTVQKYPFPNVRLDVEVPEGALCAAGSNEITISNSEENVYYMLKNTDTDTYLDTIYGNGGRIQFLGRKPAGHYKIEMAYKGLCAKKYYDTFTVSDVPPKATVSDCDYCQDADIQETGCELYLAGLKTTAEYVLYNKANSQALDTLYGVSAGYYKALPAGNYFVTGTYIENQCADVVAEMSIRRLTKPKVYPIVNANGGGDCATEVQVTLSGGYEGDSVKYYLYMDGFYQVEGPVTASQTGVNFKKYKTPGNYTVYAVKGDGTCSAWMDGSVVLYDRPANAVLKVNGYNCSGEASEREVTITATKTERDWKYYIANETSVSEKKEGAPYVELTWNKIGGKRLPSGRYILYASNACDSVIAMDTAWVYDAAAPQQVSLKRYRDGVVCDEDSYAFNLDASERGVTYTLNFGEETFEAIGDGKSELHLGSVTMNTNQRVAMLYATVDTSQCTYFIDSLRLIKDRTTENPHVVGTDTCVEAGSSITISLHQPRVPLLDYYLMVNGHPVDTIRGDAPTSNLSFKPQTEIGCYSLYATSETRKCDAEYPARCMSLAPDVRSIATDWNGQLCEGESHEVVVLQPQAGVKYHLVKNDVVQRDSAYGEGESLVVAQVSEPGNYKVLARVSDACTALLDGELNVVLNPKPELHVVKEYTYIKGGNGVEIMIPRPTSPGVYYQIGTKQDYPNKTIYYAAANEYGDAVNLSATGIRYKAGTYMVWTFQTGPGAFKCVAVDSIVVKEVGVEEFDLEVIGTPYMCEAGECRKLRLSGSEKGTHYELFRRAGEKVDFVASADGSGKTIDFGSQCDTGYYYVIASKDILDVASGETIKAEARMGAEVHLYVASKLERYRLIAESDGYCYLGTDGMPAAPGGSVILESSQSDQVTYQLYCNNNPVPGQTLTGTSGGKLKWSNLLGKTCDKNSDIGNEYKVVATDGKCQVEMSGTVNIVAVNPPQLIKQPHDVSVCTGELAVLGIQAYGCLLHYEWRSRDRIVHTDEGDVLVKGEIVGNSSSYVIDSVTMADMGVYECTVSNYCKSIDIDTITVSVREVVRMPEKMADKMVCGTATDSVKLASLAVGENYFWYKSGSTDTLAKTPVLTLKNVTEATDAGDYVCCTWNSCGALFDTVRLEFNREPDVTGFTYRTDTLCAGSAFELNIESRDTLYWYRNDRLISGKQDQKLQIDSVTYAEAGTYKVLARNACKEKEFNLVRLHIDDTLRPAVLPVDSKHYCEGSLLQLDVQFEPSADPEAGSRIYTTWAKRNIVDPRYTNALTYSINTTARDEGGFIEVNYWNKCGGGSKVHYMYIDKPVKLANFVKDSVVSVCSGEGKTEVIIRDPVQNLPSYNTYQWFKRSGSTTIPAGNSDTLQIEKKVANTGVFYCVVSNTCSTVTSGDVNLHIDTLPTVIIQPKADNPYCENSTLAVKMKARGGDLKYNWYAIKKNSTVAERVGYLEKGEIESEAQCTMEKLSYDFDSCRLWCMVENDCGYVLTDTVIVRVDREVDLRTNRSLAYICPDDVAKVVVSTTVPTCTRWDYYVAREGEEKVLHSVAGSDTDTLRLNQEGVYRIFDIFTTDTKCYAAESEVVVTVQPHDLFYVSLDHVGRDTVCRGESVRLRVKVEGGEAPWRIDIRRRGDGNTAPELGSLPVEIWSNDTIFELNVITDQKFYIASASQFTDPDACAGIVRGEDVLFVIQQPYGTRIGNVTDTVFGQCEQVNLVNLLQPYPDASIGKFYLNGKLSDDNILSGAAGRYKVVYRAETSAGCADSAQIYLRLDKLPEPKLSLSTSDICHGGKADLLLEANGAGAFNFTIRAIAYDVNGKMIGRPTSLSNTMDNAISYALSYDETMNSSDSYRTYQLISITDKHGCVVRPADEPLKLNCRKSPGFRVTGRHPIVTGNNEDETIQNFVVPVSNKIVSFMVYMPNELGTKPWNSYVEYTRPDGSIGTSSKLKLTTDARLFQSTEAGTYRFTVSDAYCPGRKTVVRTVTVLDTVFIKTKVILEGAYRKDEKKMASTLWTNNQVPNAQWGNKWPVLGERKGVDWVTLELRKDSVNGEKAFSGQFLLLDDGTVVDRTGSEALPIPNVDFDTKYHLVIKHRNHLAIGSALPVTLAMTRDEAVLMDMRMLGNIYVKEGDATLHVVWLGQINSVSVFGMCVGDVFDNALITINNANESIWKAIDEFGYHKADVNFDGFVTIPQISSSDGKLYPDPAGAERDDMSKIYNNRDKFSEIIN